MIIAVLRLSHRNFRDKRISTHLALTARTFGAEAFHYTGEYDSHIEESVTKILQEWGGKLEVNHIKSYKKIIKDWQVKGGIVVHLTMYGIELSDSIEDLKLRIKEDLLVIIGGVKVPGEIFRLADFNIAISNQPHSEVAALAVFLDNITEGRARIRNYSNAKIKIQPSERLKIVDNIQRNEI